MELEEILNEAYKLLENGDYNNSLDLLLKANEIEPNNAITITDISSCYHELHEYEQALNWAKKAYSLHSKDPYVRWNYAGVLYANDNYKEAIKAWKMLINRGLHNIGLVDCKEGIRWARSIYNDCFYRIGLAYYYLKNYKKAIEYYHKHLELRGKGIRSIYSKKEIIQDLNKAKEASLTKKRY